MAAFEYQALDTRGHTVKGILEGDAERQIRSMLRDKGLTPLQVDPIKEDEQDQKNPFSFRRRLSAADLSLITRQFATLVHAGLTIEECLNALVEQTESNRVRTILAGVRGRVLEGQSLASGLQAFPSAFPQIYRAMISAGEQSGQLDEVLEKLADYVENRQALRDKLIQAFIYPAMVTLFALAMVVGLMVVVVPQVIGVFDDAGQQLPFLTRVLISTSNTLRAGGIWWFVGAGLLFLGVNFAFKQPAVRNRWHRLLLRLPVTGRLVRGLNAERFSSTMGILVSSGIPLLDAMQSGLQVVTNIPMKHAVDDALKQVREGGNLSRALDKAKVFPPLVIHLIASGEATGRLDAMLERAAAAQSRELESWVKTFTALLEPILIIFMGVMVLLIVLAILLPIMDIYQFIG